MAATFNELLPTDRDRLRLLIGDVVNLPDGALYSDEAYDAEIAVQGGYMEAGVTLIRGLITRFAQEPDSVSISGEFSVAWKERIPAWTALLASFEGQVTTAAAAAVAFGSVAAQRDGIVRGEYRRDVYF